MDGEVGVGWGGLCEGGEGVGVEWEEEGWGVVGEGEGWWWGRGK